MAERVTVEGAAELSATLGTAARAMDRDLDKPAADLADQIERTATRRAPKRTGALAASGRSVRGVVTFGSANVAYAPPINFGTGPRIGLRGPHNIRATAFFTGAVAMAADKAADTFEPPVQKILDRVKGA